MDNELLKNAASGWFSKLSLLADNIGLSADERASERDNLIKQVHPRSQTLLFFQRTLCLFVLIDVCIDYNRLMQYSVVV
jgi:hypothetical protein